MRKGGRNRGFTIMELIVVVAIISIMAAVIVFNRHPYDDTVSLQNSATTVELGIREAQVWSQGAREYPYGSGSFDHGYGAYFSSAYPDSLIFFADLLPADSQNKKYDGGEDCAGSSECIRETSLPSNYSISSLCAGSGPSSLTCGLSSLNVVFTRPGLTATIMSGNTEYQYAEIQILSPHGQMGKVGVSETGIIEII